MRGRRAGEGDEVWGREVRRRRGGKHESDAGEFRSGLAPLLTGWHPQDTRQHPLSSSFIIHALTMSDELTVQLSLCLQMQRRG